MVARGQLQKNLWAQKLLKSEIIQILKSEIIQILLSHSPPYGDVQVTFSRFTEIKNGPTDQIQFFGGRKNAKKWSQK